MNRIVLITAFVSIVFMLGYSILSPGESTSAKMSQTTEFPENYIPYSEVDFLQARTNGRAVLYFHAPWCSTCTILEDEIQTRGTDLPQDVTILKIDYDRASDLKKAYRVVAQHTLVLVDEDGKEIKKWIGGDLDEVQRQLL